VEEHLLAFAGIPARPLVARRPLKQMAEYSINAKVGEGTQTHEEGPAGMQQQMQATPAQGASAAGMWDERDSDKDRGKVVVRNVSLIEAGTKIWTRAGHGRRRGTGGWTSTRVHALRSLLEVADPCVCMSPPPPPPAGDGHP
jgi:hypothetical protein